MITVIGVAVRSCLRSQGNQVSSSCAHSFILPYPSTYPHPTHIHPSSFPTPHTFTHPSTPTSIHPHAHTYPPIHPPPHTSIHLSISPHHPSIPRTSIYSPPHPTNIHPSVYPTPTHIHPSIPTPHEPHVSSGCTACTGCLAHRNGMDPRRLLPCERDGWSVFWSDRAAPELWVTREAPNLVGDVGQRSLLRKGMPTLSPAGLGRLGTRVAWNQQKKAGDPLNKGPEAGPSC